MISISGTDLSPHLGHESKMRRKIFSSVLVAHCSHTQAKRCILLHMFILEYLEATNNAPKSISSSSSKSRIFHDPFSSEYAIV